MTITLAPVGRVSGIVVADDPSAAGGLTVRAFTRPHVPRPGPAMGEAGAVTDAGGRFAIPALAAGRLALHVVVPKGSGLSPRLPADRTVEPGKATEVEIPLEGPGRLRTLAGRVIDRRGEPVAGAVVFQSGDAPTRTRAESDAQGGFRLPGVSAERTFVFVRANGYRFAGRAVSPTDAEITLTATPEDQPPETSRPLCRLRCRVPRS
ncbi:MAG: carboxypeptidase-like regulatory domain-containing protein [Singulisphaera sp.]